MSFNIKHFKYVDDADRAVWLKVSDYLAEAGGLEEIPLGNPEKIGPIGRRLFPRHLKLVQIDDRPGRYKYRCDVITNERDPLKVLNKEFTVNGFCVRCVKFVGEQLRG